MKKRDRELKVGQTMKKGTLNEKKGKGIKKMEKQETKGT